MKKILLSLGTILAVAGFLSIASNGAQASGPTKISLKWQKELKPENCNAVGKPIVNVLQKVSKDADSGIAGNYWAFDNYTRHIRVWNTPTEGAYCTIVKYEGVYSTIPGQKSPGNTAIISKKSCGSMQGGYIGTIKGNLLDPTLWQKKGFVGKYDYNCDVNGVCPGRVSWMDQYFQGGYGFDYIWWGWIYRGDHHGTWVNAQEGNMGDIK